MLPFSGSGNRSLRAKLLFGTGLLVGGVVAVLLLLVSRDLRQLILRETQFRGLAIAQSFAASNLNQLKNYNTIAIEQNARRAKQENHLAYLLVYDKEGRIVVHTEDPSLLYSNPNEADAGILVSLQSPIARINKGHLAEVGLHDQSEVLDVLHPIFTPQSPGRWGVVRLGLSLGEMHITIWKTQLQIIEIGLVVLFFGLIATHFLAKRITVPISELVGGALSAATGNLTQRISVRTGDELERLADTFNYMMDQIRTHQEERIRTERMVAVGNMVNTVVHDCRAPVTIIRGYASLLSDFDVQASQRKECLDSIEFEVGRIERMFDEILQFSQARNNSELLDEVVLDDFLRECAREIAVLLRSEGVKFLRELQCPYRVAMNKDRLRRAVLNLAANAREALKGQGTFRMESGVENSLAIIVLEDSGPGIPSEILSRLFDPFFTHGKPMGFGLGLSITHKIIKEHNGDIGVESEIGKGTRFRISLPITNPVDSDRRVSSPPGY